MTIYEILSLTSIGAVLVGSAWAWSQLAARRRAGLQLLDLEPAPPVPWSIIDVLIMLLLTLVINSILNAVAIRYFGFPKVLQPDAPPKQMATAIFLFSISCFTSLLLTLLIVPLRTGATYRDLGIAGGDVLADIKTGATAFFALVVPVYVIQIVLTLIWKETSHPLVGLLREEPTVRYFVMSGFSAVLIAPVVEEFFFRVLLQGWLETVLHQQALARHALMDTIGSNDRDADTSDNATDAGLVTPPSSAGFEVNPYISPSASNGDEQPKLDRQDSQLIRHPSVWAIVISATLFAIVHSSNGPDPIALFVLALGLGYVYQRTHRVLPCIVVHVMLNALTLFQLWLVVHMEQ